MSDIEKAQRTVLEENLLQYAGVKSPVEIAEKFGLRPEEVARTITRLLDSRDWLSIRQQEMLMLIEMEDLKTKVLKRLNDMSDEDYSKTLAGYVNIFKIISERLDSRKKDVAADIEKITSKHAQLFGNTFDVALTGIVEWLISEYPEIDESALTRQVQLSLKSAALEMQEQVDELGL